MTNRIPGIVIDLVVFGRRILPEQLRPGYRTPWLYRTTITGETAGSIPWLSWS